MASRKNATWTIRVVRQFCLKLWSPAGASVCCNFYGIESLSPSERLFGSRYVFGHIQSLSVIRSRARVSIEIVEF